MINKICIVIPAYEPDYKLIDLIDDLIKNSINKIIIVDDGSSKKCKYIFDALAKNETVTLIKHKENIGKGAALKSAFKYLCSCKSHEIIVTADADGQHLIKDIMLVASEMTSSKTFVIGYRKFCSKIPLRSLIGNQVTRKIFNFVHKSQLLDTQTGLRSFSRDLLPDLMDISGNRYEYETKVLSKVVKSNIEIKQVPIKTVYIENNSSSHFNPLLDSMKIYFTFARYLIISLISFLIDISIFYLQIHLGYGVFFATYSSRTISGIFNFYFNKNFAFSFNSSNYLKQLILYLLLCILISSLSALMVNSFSYENPLNITIVKIFVDIFLFFFSFLTQRYLVFR